MCVFGVEVGVGEGEGGRGCRGIYTEAFRRDKQGISN